MAQKNYKSNNSIMNNNDAADSAVAESLDKSIAKKNQEHQKKLIVLADAQNTKKGRPKKLSEKKYNKKVNTYLTNEDYEKLKMIADNNEETVAKFVRKIIKDYINGLN